MEDVVDDSFNLDNDTTLDGAQVLQRRSSEKTSTTTGTCQQCVTLQKLIKKKVTCKLFIEAGEEHLTVRAYEDILTAIVQPDEQITCENLLASCPSNLEYKDYHVLTSVSRI